MTGVIKVDDIQDAGANSIVSSNGSGTLTLGSFSAPNITASTALLPDASDGAAIGSASLEFSDLFLADGAVINLGDDQDVTLTHVADTGITLNSTMKLMFNDASQYIQGASATVLDIAATDEIELTATLIEVVGNATVSGTLGVTGVTTSNAGVVVDNITIDGTEIDLSSGDLTLDVAGDIILDAAGEQIRFHDAGTLKGFISMASDNITLKSETSDKDIIFQGNDGGSAITALTLDMSDAGMATFNNGIILGAGGINFPDSTTDSADANVLTDYEHGQWTVSAEQENTGNFPTAMTQGNRQGEYVKIGRMIHVTFYNVLADNGSLVNSPLRFAGLPFVVGNTGYSGGGGGIQAYNWATAAPDNVIAVKNTDYMNLHERVTSDSLHNATNSKCDHVKTDSSYCYGSITYHDIDF